MNKIGKLMVVALGLWAGAANAATGKSEVFPLDLTEGERVSAGSEELTFSNLWDGDAEATVTIAQDGAAIFTGLSGEGVKTWTVDRNGRYELTHTTYTNGAPSKVETAVFVVEGKEIPVRELTIDWGQKSFVYDGQPKEPVVTVKDGATTLTKGTHYLVEYKDNINVGTAKAIVKGLEPYVEAVTNTFTITKGELPPGDNPDPSDPGIDPDDPGQREDPAIRFSKFDYVGMYDGEAHTIDTNALKAAYEAVIGNGFTVSYAVGESGGLIEPALPWMAEPIAIRDVGVTSFWYKVTSANYEDFVRPCKVAITPRSIEGATVILGNPLAYTGKEQRQTIEAVKVGGLNVTYTVEGDCTTEKGEHELTITGTGNFTGTIKKKYGIYAVSVKARQRYPWNGLVDVDIELDGANGEACAVELFAIDPTTRTNVTMNVVMREDGKVVSTLEKMLPGKYRWVWDAAADLPAGWESDVSLRAKLHLLRDAD